VQISVETSKREVLLFITASMLPWNDVLNVKAANLLVLLAQVTILAPVPGPLSYALAQGGVHHPAWAWVSHVRALACRMATRSQADTHESYSARSAGVSRPSVFFAAKFFHACLGRIIQAQRRKNAGRFHSEVPVQRFQHPVHNTWNRGFCHGRTITSPRC